MKYYIKTLGCEKNTVDSEHIAGWLGSLGHVMTEDPDEADVIFVNTCSFINDAKQQSINTILEFGQEKKDGQKLIALGCLAQRYPKEILKAMPELDSAVGVNSYSRLDEIMNTDERIYLCSDARSIFEELGSRVRLDTPWTSPIKIAEGCSNICTYCAIPYIRGRYRSRLEEDILREAESLAEQGTKELVVIAQDVTNYGMDLTGGEDLPGLLHKLCRINGIEWVRLMYCYEDEITQELIDCINSEPKICRYLDIPIQHCCDRILKRMNRKSTRESIRFTINNLRKQIPGLVIRTTLISGFPGETKEDHLELMDFVEEMRFDRLGVFAYSKEDNTPAAKMDHQVRKDVKERRRDSIMALQREISLSNNQKYIGRTLSVLVDECCEDGTYIGRTYMDAPDIDNSVIFTSKRPLYQGDFTDVKINDAFDYDLCGIAVEE